MMDLKNHKLKAKISKDTAVHGMNIKSTDTDIGRKS